MQEQKSAFAAMIFLVIALYSECVDYLVAVSLRRAMKIARCWRIWG